MPLCFVRPAEGKRIVDPVRRDRLPADTWRPVTPSPYWHRLRRDGDVELRTTAPEESETEGYENPPEATESSIDRSGSSLEVGAAAGVIAVGAAEVADVNEKGGA